MAAYINTLPRFRSPFVTFFRSRRLAGIGLFCMDFMDDSDGFATTIWKYLVNNEFINFVCKWNLHEMIDIFLLQKYSQLWTYIFSFLTILHKQLCTHNVLILRVFFNSINYAYDDKTNNCVWNYLMLGFWPIKYFGFLLTHFKNKYYCMIWCACRATCEGLLSETIA